MSEFILSFVRSFIGVRCHRRNWSQCCDYIRT